MVRFFVEKKSMLLKHLFVSLGITIWTICTQHFENSREPSEHNVKGREVSGSVTLRELVGKMVTC